VALFKRPRQPFYYVKDETLGWASRCQGEIKIHRVDFPHRMLREPYVRDLAKRLSACLAEVAGRPLNKTALHKDRLRKVLREGDLVSSLENQRSNHESGADLSSG
jgi:hypothetical protein